MSALPPPARDAASDAVLIRAVAGGDRAAFVALFERYAGRVKAFAMRRGATPADAEEIVQDVLVAVWRHAGSFDPARAAASTWIFTIARNRRVDLARRVGRERLPDPEDPTLVPEPWGDPLRALEAAESEGRLRAAIAALPAAQRAVLVAGFYEGLSHGEIARRLGLPLGTVKSRIRLAFRHLQRILGADLAEGFGDD
jgi:RNA polymerase sigma-70 factor (ECF subfamily)